MADNDRRQLARPRQQAPTVDMARNTAGGFDVDAWHAMNARDDALVNDEILNGSGSNKFVYNFPVQGKEVTGISVIGARHLASHYGGIKHRIVASTQKQGRLFIFTSYPHETTEMKVSCATIEELEEEPDFYSVLVETQDVKTGNTSQVECIEERYQQRRNSPEKFDRPNYQKIAQAKARRNGILDLIPQDIQIRWKLEMLKLGRADDITDSVIEEKRSAVLTFATKNAIPLLREQISELTMDQIQGLSEAAREGKVPAFANAAKAAGLVAEGDQDAGQKVTTDTKQVEEKPKEGATAESKTEKSPQETGGGGATGGAATKADKGKKETAAATEDGDGHKAPRELFKS